MLLGYCFRFFFKQKTAYEVRISDWSSDVCSSDLTRTRPCATKIAAPSPDFNRLPFACAASSRDGRSAVTRDRVQRDRKQARAKGAIDLDQPRPVGHVAPLRLGEFGQHAGVKIGRAHV